MGPTSGGDRVLLRMEGIEKGFGRVQALKGVDFSVGHKEVVALLGDNGAGKSTLIKVLCGIFPPNKGNMYMDGERVHFSSPRQARAQGIETVYQDLALIPLMSIARNFFLGREPVRRIGPLRFLDHKAMERTTKEALAGLGITIRSPEEAVSVLSGGERQSIAIGRTLHFGAKLLILDEPTSALSLKESAKVLRYVCEVREKGLSVIFISHNIHHVYPIADRFVVLYHGKKCADLRKEETTQEEIERLIITGRKELPEDILAVEEHCND